MRENIYILHLSDLHIQKNFPANGLLGDIRETTKNIQELIIVISGDIIDQGDYKTHMPTALEFFENLKAKLEENGSNILDIIIAPGNHDKERTRVTSLLSHGYVHVDEAMKYDSDEDVRAAYMSTYEQFNALKKKIYNSFGKHTEDFGHTFGVKYCSSSHVNIIFLIIDTAWCSFSQNDCKKLRIGDFQLDSLYQGYQKLCKKNPSNITIAVSHHPLSWLMPSEEEKLHKYFLSKNYLNTDIHLCGHVHDHSIVHHFNHDHSLLTLVTGVNKSENESFETMQRYSLYALNYFNNSCEITVRKTNKNGNFSDDYSVYTNDNQISGKKIRYPLKSNEFCPYVNLESTEFLDSATYFIDGYFLENAHKVANTIQSISKSIASLYSNYIKVTMEDIKNNLDNTLPNNQENKEKWQCVLRHFETLCLSNADNNIRHCFQTEKAFERFLVFLNEVCDKIKIALDDIFEDKSIKIRVHFRIYNQEDDKYVRVASRLGDSLPIRPVPYESLIRKAQEKGCTLIGSLNRKINPLLNSILWDDFITIVPRFDSYLQNIFIGDKKINRPLLSFGISVGKIDERKKEKIKILYLLSYFKFETTITEVINDYIRLFMLDPNTFLSAYEKKLEEKN